MEFLVIKSGAYELPSRERLDANYLGGGRMQTAEDWARSYFQSQVSVYPDGGFQEERDSSFTDVVSLGLFDERCPLGVNPFYEQLRIFSFSNGSVVVSGHNAQLQKTKS
jgi:hypothetical protein